MEHTCQDCDHKFFDAGQSQDSISPAVSCPNCHSYRTQPSGMPDEANDMVHGIGAMPNQGQQDDMSGNPLQEGILADGGWKNRSVRDEAFASVRMSLFETPDFETTQLIAPPDLYRHGMETEAAHRATIQLPKGITDNLHATLGNLQAWVESPHENGELRPYYNKYWKTIRPSFMKPGSLQIGVADPTMAEIINHVAQTDDPTPLYQYRGTDHAASLIGDLAGGALAGGSLLADAVVPEIALPAEAAAALAGGTEAAGTAGAAAGVGGLMKKVAPGLGTGFLQGAGRGAFGLMDDAFGTGAPGGQSDPSAGLPVQSPSYYSRFGSDEDSLHPNVHDEIPQNDDGDSKQQSDGNGHEWQRDISVNGVGGTDHSPSFDETGPGMSELKALLPLIMKYLDSGEDASGDPQISALHDMLEGELPGYLDHADEGAAHKLIAIIAPGGAATPEANEPDHTDENSGGGHESKVAQLTGEAAEFMPDFTVTAPSLNGARLAVGPMMPPPGGPPMGGPPPGGPPGMPPGGAPPMPGPPPAPPGAEASQGPVTDEQQAFFAKWLIAQDRADEVPGMIDNPQAYAKEFAEARNTPAPPEGDTAGLSAGPPMPAQEEAPPGDTMPVPGMSVGPQMMAAVARYAADSVATRCPKCKSHTTGLIDDEGTTQCHGCKHIFKTPGLHPNKLQSTTASTEPQGSWNVDEDLRKEALAGDGSHDFDLDTGSPIQGVPIADQTQQRDVREEQDTGHTWADEEGNPLKVGQEYEMYSDKYDIPDLVRIEAVKPGSLVYTLTGEFGLEHSTELTKEEADIERISFKSNTQDGELGPADDGSLEHNDDDNTAYTGSPERTDMSAPSGLVSAALNPKLAWLEPETFRTAGASYTPMEQRALIEESGTARNADLLDLVNTHYVSDADEDQFLFGV